MAEKFSELCNVHGAARILAAFAFPFNPFVLSPPLSLLTKPALPFLRSYSTSEFGAVWPTHRCHDVHSRTRVVLP